jgi:hypothetical protein
MADDAQTAPTKPGYLEGHRLYRDRIVSKDQLIHYRTSWSIWIQTSLVIIVDALAVNLTSEKCSAKEEQLYSQLIYDSVLSAPYQHFFRAFRLSSLS